MNMCVVKKMVKWALVSVLKFVAVSASIVCLSFGIVYTAIWIENAGWKNIVGYIVCALSCAIVAIGVVGEARKQYRVFKQECEE